MKTVFSNDKSRKNAITRKNNSTLSNKVKAKIGKKFQDYAAVYNCDKLHDVSDK